MYYARMPLMILMQMVAVIAGKCWCVKMPRAMLCARQNAAAAMINPVF
jgi:hypothetical protein